MHQKTALIIGAGPAGLTAAKELLDTTDILPIILETEDWIGGIARTAHFNGNLIDMGPHRFFSKSDRVMNWWKQMLPLEGRPQHPEKKLVLVARMTRIYYLKKFFDYPISLSVKTLSNLGIIRTIQIGISYIKSKIAPVKPEKNLEDFFINRFGRKLYSTFFEEYTAKVWGVPCSKIPAAWGAQRVKDLSILTTVLHALKKMIPGTGSGLEQKKTQTSLIEKFIYPNKGAGQMWETAAEDIKNKGGEILLKHHVTGFKIQGNQIKSVVAKNAQGEVCEFECDYVLSSMAIKDLIRCFGVAVPPDVLRVGDNLAYRDFITVALVVKKLKVKNTTGIKTHNDIIPDNWIYIQESGVKIGRLSFFNNFSETMVKDKNTVLLGTEYFVYENDELWNLSDAEMTALAAQELDEIGIISKEDVLDSVVHKITKAYPSYIGSYDEFPKIQEFTDSIKNLFLMGRNGMHRYNNQDHSMLSAMQIVDNIRTESGHMENVWAVNTEKDYHEEKKS
jgi:protoporphyrinogen oxidase